MLEALEKYLPKDEAITWTKPDGGLFLWVQLPEKIDVEAMFYKAVDRKVAYVIGTAFYSDEGGKNAMRLNFSFPSEEEIITGVKRLAGVIESFLKG